MLWECMGTFWPFLIVISMTRTTSFSKTIFADFGATLRMCFAKPFCGLSCGISVLTEEFGGCHAAGSVAVMERFFCE